jgi:autotransporter-associated beta strand protein
VTVGSGAVLDFIAPNATATGFNKTNIPTLIVSGGTVTNAEPGAPFPAGQINNALNNIALTDGVLTATTGQHSGYAAWNVNGTVTSSGQSLISTSDSQYGTVMLNSTGGSSSVGVTPFNVTDGTLTVSAPLVQDTISGDHIAGSALQLIGGGTMVLSGTNTYNGGTTVNNGTLIATNSEAIADGTSLAVGDPSLLGLLPAAVVPSPAPLASAAAVTAVPEPGTLALFAAAAAAWATRVWRRRNAIRI